MLRLIELCGVTPAPGPASMFMLGTGLVGIGWVGRKKAKDSKMVWMQALFIRGKQLNKPNKPGNSTNIMNPSNAITPKEGR